MDVLKKVVTLMSPKEEKIQKTKIDILLFLKKIEDEKLKIEQAQLDESKKTNALLEKMVSKK